MIPGARRVNLLCFAVGAAYTWTSPVLPKLKSLDENPFHLPISIFEESWIASNLGLGAAIGPILSGTCVDKLGRKNTLLLFAIPAVLSHVLFAFGNHVIFFLIGRFLVGLTAGCAFTVVPMYVGEISNTYNRGSLGCIMGIMVTFGGFFSLVIGPYTTISMFSFINLLPVALFIIVCLLIVPESPYYLISVNKLNEAADSLKRLRNTPDRIVEKEIIEISEEVEEMKAGKGEFKDLFKSAVLVRGLVISCGLMVFQQFAGICAVLSYMQSIFNASGSSLPDDISAMLVGFVQVVMNIAASQLVDRLGRKILLLTSSLGTSLSLITLGTYFYMCTNKYNVENLFWMPVTSLVAFTITFNVGLGPLPWAIMGELFPPSVKVLACTITTCVCLSLSFFVIVFFPHLSQRLSMAYMFWSFGAFSFAAFIFVIFTVPETKGKTFQEIQAILS